MLDIKLKIEPGHTSERDWMAPSPLTKLFWNVTAACNFQCPICFADGGRPRAGELTTAEARKMLASASRAGVRDIIISGGEPFCRPDILDLLEEMADLGITARIATNGTLLSDEALDRLRRETRTLSFQVSLDSLDPEVYSAVHGVPGQHLDAALRALRGIRERGFHTTVSTRLTAATLPTIPEMLDRAVEEGWATVTVHIPVHTRRCLGAPGATADALSLLGPVFDHFCRLRRRWLVETYIPWAPYHPMMERLAERVRVVHCGCRAGRDRLTIQPDGAITPCVCLDVPEVRLGNVRSDDLAEVFERSALLRVYRRPEEFGICGECPHVRVCGGGCRTTAFALTGRVDGQDGSCPIWQRFIAAGKEPVDAS